MFKSFRAEVPTTENSPLISSASQWPGFYIIGTTVMKELNKQIHQINRKWMFVCLNSFYGKMWVALCLNSGKRFFVKAIKGLFNNYVTCWEWVGLNVLHDVAWRKTRGEWHLMKGCNATVKKNHKTFFCTIVTRSGIHKYRTLMVS